MKMPTRDQRIAVSRNEKQKLDAVRNDLFGEDNVAYGAIISLLADTHLNSN